MDRNARTRWWFVQGLTVLGLAVVFGFFFLAWLPAQRDYLTQRSFRQLADMGDLVQEGLANLHTSLTNAARGAVAQALWASSYVQNLSGIDQTNPRRVFADQVRTIEPKVELVSEVGDLALHSDAALVGPQVNSSRGLGRYWLDLTYHSRGPTDSNMAFQVRTDLGALMKPVLARSEFDDVLIVNTNGEVVFQLAEAGQRITNLSAAAELRFTRVPDFARDSRSEDRLLGTNIVTGVTTSGELELADGTCKVFVQPLTFSLSPGLEAGETIQWHLCGLMRSHVFQERAMALPPTAIILFFFGALACLLAWPFLNLAFAGPRNPPGRGIASAVATAGFLGCAALAFLVLDTGGYSQMEEVMDQQVKQLTTTLTDNLHRELSAVHRQLQRFNDLLTAAAECATLDDTASTNDVSLRAWAQLPVEEISTYPWLRQAFWGGRNGRQTHKWTPALKTTPFLSLASRPYFVNIIEQHAWPVQCPTHSTFPIHSSFYLEPLFSRTRGENMAVLAEPFTEFAGQWPTNIAPGGDVWVLTNRPMVACLEFRPLALMQPIVPAGYGFAVVDATGLVLFHSDERRNLRENFLKECDHKSRLLGALRGRTTDDFDVRYLNRLHHVRVTPLACLPWSLIVFRDEQVLGSSRRAMLSGAGVLFGLYALWLLALLAATPLAAKAWRGMTGRPEPTALTWLWPSPARARSYLGLTLWLLVLTGAYVALTWGTAEPTPIVAASLALPILVLGPAVARLGGWRRRADVPVGRVEGRSAESFSYASFPAFLAMALVVLGMLPALGSFRLVSRIETAALLRSGQLDLARDLRERQSRIRQELGLLPEVTSSQLLARRLAETLDRGDAAFFATQTSNAPLAVNPSLSDWFAALYRTIRLRADDTAVTTGGVLPARASDGSWQSQVKEGRLVTEVAGANPLGEPSPLQIATTLPTFHWPELGGTEGLWYALLVFAAVAPFIIADFVARQVFLWGLWPRGAKWEWQAHTTALSPASVERAPLPPPIRTATQSFVARERLHVQVIDLARAEDRVWLVRGRAPALERGGVVVLAHPDRASDADESMKTLRTELGRDPARTVVVLEDKLTSIAVGGSGYGKRARPRLGDSTTREDLSAQAVRQLCQDHERRWQECLPEEKWLLYHVARTGLAPAAAPEMQTLLAKGILRLDPRLRLHSESFRRFVLARFPADRQALKLAEGETNAASSQWQAWKSALGVGLTAVALFLFMTQRELWQLVVGLATTFVAGFGQFNKITGLFQRQKKNEETD